ncbi:hypothetical protein MesoLj113b_29380 [Mesorhizobium sp. 113-3-3]|nr:hypothetical protein MesoLj113b_29380 [Mesorhizobium sp. 113-3-3]
MSTFPQKREVYRGCIGAQNGARRVTFFQAFPDQLLVASLDDDVKETSGIVWKGVSVRPAKYHLHATASEEIR